MTIFEFRNQKNEAKRFGKTDPKAPRESVYTSLAGIDPDGNGELMLIEDFDLSEGDVLKFKNARNVNGDGFVKDTEEFTALER